MGTGVHPENHISPDGRYVLICTQGLKIYQFIKEQQEGKPKVSLQETGWTLPIKTDDMEHLELARRVRFEAKNVVRVLTREDRDILFELMSD